MSRIIFVEHRDIAGNLKDPIEVTLTSSPDESPAYGIRRSDGAIVVPAGTPVPRISLGRYEYEIGGLDQAYEYVFEFKVVDECDGYGIDIDYIEGSIPSVSSPPPLPSAPERVIFIEHCDEKGNKIDAALVELQSPPGLVPSFGIRRIDNNIIVIPPAVPVPRVSLGRYEFNVEFLDTDFEYEYYFKITDVVGDGYGGDGITYIRGRIEQRSAIYPTYNVGDPVPEGFIPTPVDWNGDGVYDAYGYDTDGDGLLDAFDTDMDGFIDSYDTGGPLVDPDAGESRRDGFARPGSDTQYDGPPDGIPDVRAPRGTPAHDGTFGGGPGFDGTRGDTPATGGDRTNRDESLGDGYWDGISYEKLCTTPIGKRGQCVTGNTLVDSEIGAMQIKDVKIGDKLKVYNINNKTFEFQRVTKVHKNNTKNGVLYKIKTNQRRELTCTSMHPFVVRYNKDHVYAQDLKISDQLVVEPLASKYKPIQYERKIIFDKEIIESKLSKIYNKKQIRGSLKDFEKNKYINFDNTDDRALILARIVGHMFGDGSLVYYKNTNGLRRLGLSYFCGSVKEIQEVKNEVESLGFNVCDIITRKSDSGIANGESSSSQCRQAFFSELMYVLGVPLGDKVAQETSIPDWIFNNNNYLREFLAALYGSEGYNCTTKNGTLNFLGLSFNKVDRLKDNGKEYGEQLCDAFNKFGIKMRVLEQPNSAIRKYGDITTCYIIMRDGDSKTNKISRKALIQFCEQIGIRYSPDKQQDFREMCEYQRYVNGSCNTRRELCNKCIELKKQGFSRANISKKLGISDGCVDNWLYGAVNLDDLRLSREDLKFSQWRELYIDRGEVYDEIIDIQKIESDEDVYDVTMETLFDFVTNGIVTLDCYKDKAAAGLRTMLKDTNPACWAFTEDEIDMYLETSLWSFNAMPTFSNFGWSELEDRWLHIIIIGGLVWALYAQSLIEAGREFTITDSGIAFTPPPVSDKMQNYAAQMLTFYKEQLDYIKANFKPSPSSVGVFTVLDISPSLRRLRFLREKRVI